MSSSAAETILLTIFLKHDQSQNLEAIQSHLSSTGWWERFPPKGVEIVSWNVVMGIGQIVTLRLPPHLLNVVNVEIERCAWGVFSTEFSGRHAVPDDRPLRVHGDGRRSQGVRPRPRPLHAQILPVLRLRPPLAPGGLQVLAAQAAAEAPHPASELTARVIKASQHHLPTAHRPHSHCTGVRLAPRNERRNSANRPPPVAMPST